MSELIFDKSYVSCIKIRGIHLLPPVITNERRLELQKYKKQAIKLEKRLQNCRELKKHLEYVLNCQPLSSRAESEITFRDNNHIDSLGIQDKSILQCTSKRTISLSQDIIDVTEYSDDGIRIINNESCHNHSCPREGQQFSLNPSNETYATDNTFNKSIEITSYPPTTPQNLTNGIQSNIQNCTLDLSELHNEQSSCSTSSSPKNNQDSDRLLENTDQSPIMFGEVNNEQPETLSPAKTPKPRLIRSNSYTLENPSPVLLAHIEKTKSEQDNNLKFNRSWVSMENNYIPFEKSEFSSINTVYQNDEKNIGDKNTPTIEVVHTDISVQHITVNAENEKNMSLDLSDLDSQLIQALKNIPEDYTKQIIELIEKQKLEKLRNIDFIEKTNCINSANDYYCESPSMTITSPSESLHFSISTADTLKPSTPLRLFDLEAEDGMNTSRSYDKEDCRNMVVIDSNMSKNIQYLPDADPTTLKKLKREWAAHVIGAHVKGYLTRRLLRTEKVQSLIETIKDALMCALQLHTAENIDESDVELHRRLINQVSAACYAFHDVFFSLSTREQMAIISSDRQRKIEKARKPTSARTPRTARTPSRQSSGRRMTSHSHSSTKV